MGDHCQRYSLTIRMPVLSIWFIWSESRNVWKLKYFKDRAILCCCFHNPALTRCMSKKYLWVAFWWRSMECDTRSWFQNVIKEWLWVEVSGMCHVSWRSDGDQWCWFIGLRLGDLEGESGLISSLHRFGYRETERIKVLHICNAHLVYPSISWGLLVHTGCR